MNYLLDTNIVSELLRTKPSPTLLQYFQQIPFDEMAICTITLGELLFGALRKPQAQSKYLPLINAFAQKITILTFDEQSARLYAEIRANLEKLGNLTGDADIRIGSIAQSNNLCMVTRNVKHFARIPNLIVENWIDELGRQP